MISTDHAAITRIRVPSPGRRSRSPGRMRACICRSGCRSSCTGRCPGNPNRSRPLCATHGVRETRRPFASAGARAPLRTEFEMRAWGCRRVHHVRLDLTLGVGGAQLRWEVSAARKGAAKRKERGGPRPRIARTRLEESCRQSSRTELELRSHALNSIETACTYMKRRGFSLRETENRSSFTGRWPCASNRDLRDRCTCGRVEPHPRVDRRRASVALIKLPLQKTGSSRRFGNRNRKGPPATNPRQCARAHGSGGTCGFDISSQWPSCRYSWGRGARCCSQRRPLSGKRAAVTRAPVTLLRFHSRRS